MDIYQIFTTYNYAWTMKEIFAALLILALAVALSLFLCRKRTITRSQAIALVFLTAFLLTVLGSTVFGRMPGERCYQLVPFWSYGAILKGDAGMLQEVLLNGVLLLPAGILLALVFNKPLKWYHGLLFGAVISSCIELSQLIFCRGLFEFDDIFHNSIGCMVGCIVSSWMIKKLEF